MNRIIDSEKPTFCFSIQEKKFLKSVSSDISHIYIFAKVFQYNLALVGETYLDRVFRPAGNFTEVELFWNSVILGTYFFGPLTDQVKPDMKHNVTSLKNLEIVTMIRQTLT